MVMFGRKETEKRSLEDMFKPIDEAVESVDDEKTNYDLDEYQKVGNVGNTEKNSCVPIKPLDCFGMEEEKTEKWLGKCVKFWFCCMSFMWFLFGALTFAPVIFISNKVNVIFNDKKKSLLCATLIHGLLLSLITIFVFVK
jgi:hypothetical protein